jgi:hypothetical protein
MSDVKHLPAFRSEEEEADWWYDNREQHAEDFVRAMAEGRVKRGGLAQRLAAARGIPMLDLPADDISRARELAERRGMEVATYLSLLVHEALEREAKVGD